MQDKEWKQGHEGFANALCWIPPVEEEEDKAGTSCGLLRLREKKLTAL